MPVMSKFAALSGEMRRMIETGGLRFGEKLPSVRALARARRLSITTVVEAYRELEASDLIEARPRSGYYVKLDAARSGVPRRRVPSAPMGLRTYRDLMPELLSEADQSRRLLRLGVASIEGSLFARESLARLTRKILRTSGTRAFEYPDPMGLPSLRRRIGALMMDRGVAVDARDVIVTSGCQEALWLALQSVCRPGDALAIESPCYPGVITMMQLMGLKAVEIPTTPAGLRLDVLERALRTHKIAACYVMPNCSNPTGLVYSEETKQQLCDLASRYDLPIIEDSANGDLYYGPSPLPSLKRYDHGDRVLFCSSFSKTVAPGFRVGWIIPGRFARRAMELKYAVSMGTPVLQQMVINRFISEGSYKRGLLRARRVLATTIGHLLRCVDDCFPTDVISHRPVGGMCAWIGLPPGVDSERLRHRALERNISIAPGRMFSPSSAYADYIRLGWGGAWTERAEAGVREVGAIAHDLSRTAANRRRGRS
jgi:DNA-binding transcriptional MocR family regulator